MKPVLVIYHSADADGWFSRELAKRHFGDKADYIGWNYGEPAPAVQAYEILYMIDVSIDELMSDPRLVWIDHHKSAMLKYSPDIQGVRIEGVAACRLAWQWFFEPYPGKWWTKEDFVERKVNEPLAIRLAGEYDVFDLRDPRALEFNDGLYLEDKENLAALLVEGTGDGLVRLVCEVGAIIGKFREKENKSIITKQGFTIRWEDLTFLCCNAARYNSHLFTAGIKPEHDGLLGFKWDGVLRRWRVSMYGVPGKPEIDFSVVASKHGGGGHKQACGFECHLLPFSLEGSSRA